MLTIYGAPKTRALRVLWMVNELGITYEHKPLLPRSPDVRTAEFLAMNPNARLPVIDDDGFVVSESMAINLYLAKKHQSPLYPSDPRQEALTLQWCLWETDRLDRQIQNYHRHGFELPAEERNPNIAEAAHKEVVPAFDVLETVLTKSNWLVGSRFTVADLNVASALVRGLLLDLSNWPHVKNWLTQCWDRPAARKALAMRTA